MKRNIILLALVCILSFSANAQTRAIGIRSGANTFEVSFQSDLSSNFFFEANAGLNNYRGESGFKADALLNMNVWKPSFTSYGDWSVYAGAGVSAGYVYDMSLSTFTHRDPYYGTRYTVHDRWGYGPMLGVAVQAGISFAFEFPLKVSLDLRPVVGLHRSERVHPESDSGHLGMYGAGISTCYYPRVSVHYLF
ncbi:MAG: hypothetical protein MJZ16_00520 [Bacteroidales bacterium]|nr:hypothetical protein [Bacteroidales bacterium]